jgi:hypothetical protein
MDHYIEIQLEGQVDRYHFEEVDTDKFLDNFITKLKGKSITGITKDEFETHPNRQHCLEFDVEGIGNVTHYIKQHETELDEQQWNDFIRQLNEPNFQHFDF